MKPTGYGNVHVTSCRQHTSRVSLVDFDSYCFGEKSFIQKPASGISISLHTLGLS